MSQATAPIRTRAARSTVTSEPAGARRALRVVPAVIERTGNGRFAALCMALLSVGLLTLLLLNTHLAQGSFAMHELTRRSGALADERHELTRALDAERNPSALAARAVGMGMVPATSMAFIRLSDGAILGVAEPARADKSITLITSPKPAPVVPPAAPASPLPAQAPAPAPAAPAAPTAAPAG